MAYLNLHFAIDARRTERGPRIMVLGPSDAGKTSLVKILAAYALKRGQTPMIVNLDPREGVSTVPGTISAMPVTNMLDIVDGFGTSRSTGTTEISPKIPLSYAYGVDEPGRNVKYFKHLLTRLSLAVNSRLSSTPKEQEGGLLVDTSGLIDHGDGYDLINTAISDLEIDVLVIMGSERLYSDMLKRYDSPSLTVLKVPKSGGVVQRDVTFVRNYQHSQIKRYFYGDARNSLNAFTLSVSFDDVEFHAVDEALGINTSLMPIGTETTTSKSFASPVAASSLLTHNLVAILDAPKGSSGEVLSESSVIGYLLITDVDDEKRKLTILAPFQGRIPGYALLVTGQKYTDT